HRASLFHLFCRAWMSSFAIRPLFATPLRSVLCPLCPFCACAILFCIVSSILHGNKIRPLSPQRVPPDSVVPVNPAIHTLSGSGILQAVRWPPAHQITW